MMMASSWYAFLAAYVKNIRCLAFEKELFSRAAYFWAAVLATISQADDT